jgi:hypothetical protein
LRHHSSYAKGERITSSIDFIITHLIQGYVIQFHAVHLERENDSHYFFRQKLPTCMFARHQWRQHLIQYALKVFTV